MSEPMLVEERCYTLKGDYTPAMYLELYKNTGALEVQTRILGNLLGAFVVEVGGLNTLVHLWGYASFEERARRRALLAAEPVWQEYLSRIRPMLGTMNTRLMLPTDYSPIRQIVSPS